MTSALKMRKPALIVSDMHIPFGKGEFAKIFKLGPDGMPAWINYRKSRVDQGVRKTVKLIEEMKGLGAPIVLTTFGTESGGKAEIIPVIRKAVKKYPHSKIIPKKDAYNSFSNPDLKKYLDMHEVDALVLCGGERGACLFQTAKSAYAHGYALMAAEDVIYVNKPYLELFGDYDVVGWVADFDSIYMDNGFNLRDAENRRCAQMDLHNLKWLERTIAENAPMVVADRYNAGGFLSLLEWAVEKRVQLEAIMRGAGIGASGIMFENGLLGREAVSEFYTKRTEFYETANEMVAKLRATLGR